MLLLPANPYVARSGRSLQLQERAGALGLSRASQGNIRMHWNVHSEVSRFRVLRGLAIYSSYPLLPHDDAQPPYKEEI